MKKNLLLLATLLLIAPIAHGQPETIDEKVRIINDSTDREALSGQEWEEITGKPLKRSKVHWSGYQIEYNGLTGAPDYMALRNSSVSLSMNLFDYALVMGRVVSLATGIGVEFNNFQFEENMTLVSENSVTVPRYYPSDIRLLKSKLATSYLNVPLIVEFSLGRKAFVNTGVIAGWRLEGHTKIKADSPEMEGVFKSRNNLHLANFHYGALLNVGYGWVALSAKYYPGSLFKHDKGPDVQQFNVGLSFLL